MSQCSLLSVNTVFTEYPLRAADSEIKGHSSCSQPTVTGIDGVTTMQWLSNLRRCHSLQLNGGPILMLEREQHRG